MPKIKPENMTENQKARVAKAKEISDTFAQRAKDRGEQGGYFKLMMGKHAEGIALDEFGIPNINLESGAYEDRIHLQGEVFYSPLDLDKRLNGKIGKAGRKFERVNKNGLSIDAPNAQIDELQKENRANMARIKELEAKLAGKEVPTVDDGDTPPEQNDGPSESQLIDRWSDHLVTLTVPELKLEAEEYGVSIAGMNKAAIVEALAEAFARNKMLPPVLEDLDD